jgi:hypothetical protein
MEGSVHGVDLCGPRAGKVCLWLLHAVTDLDTVGEQSGRWCDVLEGLALPQGCYQCRESGVALHQGCPHAAKAGCLQQGCVSCMANLHGNGSNVAMLSKPSPPARLNDHRLHVVSERPGCQRGCGTPTSCSLSYSCAIRTGTALLLMMSSAPTSLAAMYSITPAARCLTVTSGSCSDAPGVVVVGKQGVSSWLAGCTGSTVGQSHILNAHIVQHISCASRMQLVHACKSHMAGLRHGHPQPIVNK